MMRRSHFQYVLVGAGAASAAAAATIRTFDPAGPLLLVGQEINRPYHRPLLARDYLLGLKRHDELFIHDPTWYAEQHIDLRTNRRAAHLDVARHTVSLDDGQEVAFDSLLIATGAAPRRLSVPGADLPNVFHLRTLADADRLRHAIDAAHKQYLPPEPARPAGPRRAPGRAPRVAVIGSGRLGLELASTLTLLGLQVDLFSDHEHPYQKYAGEVSGRAIQRYVEQHGVRFHPNAPVSALQGDGRAQRVITPDGTAHPCDLVLVAIGVVPHKELLRGTPIAAERAILTDEFCRTNIPTILAAGDCAARFDPVFAKHRATDHWDASLSAGRIAGAAMTGTLIPSATVSSFATRVFDLAIHSFGEPRLATRRLTRSTPGTELPTFTEFATDANGRLTQILTSDPALDYAFLRNLVAGRHQLSGHEESLKDPSIPLTQLFPQ